MELDIYISRKTAPGKDRHRHWHKFGHMSSVWFREKIYDGKLDCKERSLEHLAFWSFHSIATAFAKSKEKSVDTKSSQQKKIH